MSGIYIAGIDMPTSCDKCIYSAWSNFYQIYVCNAVRKNEPVLFDGKQTKSTAVARSARADNCPLIPVPDHGRLIDADALVDKHFGKDYLEKAMTANKDEMGTALINIPLLINNAPTIIPADKEGEG